MAPPCQLTRAILSKTMQLLQGFGNYSWCYAGPFEQNTSLLTLQPLPNKKKKK